MSRAERQPSLEDARGRSEVVVMGALGVEACLFFLFVSARDTLAPQCTWLARVSKLDPVMMPRPQKVE